MPNFDASATLTRIETALAKPNGVVMVATHLKAWQFGHKHAGKFFVVRGASLFMRRGKSLDCVDFASIRTGEWK